MHTTLSASCLDNLTRIVRRGRALQRPMGRRVRWRYKQRPTATSEFVGGGSADTRWSQPGDDAVEVDAEHVGPGNVAAGHLMGFIRDAGRGEVFAELPLAGEHLCLVHAVEPVEWVRTGAGDEEDPLVSVAFDPLDRIVGADPGLVPEWCAVDRAARQVQ